MRLLQRGERGFAINSGESAEALPVFLTKHTTNNLFSDGSVLVYS
jgi:hypothetical protein